MAAGPATDASEPVECMSPPCSLLTLLPCAAASHWPDVREDRGKGACDDQRMEEQEREPSVSNDCIPPAKHKKAAQLTGACKKKKL